jgi:hypothetical protein
MLRLVATREEAGMYVTVFGDRRGTLPAGWTKETIVVPGRRADRRLGGSRAGREGDLRRAGRRRGHPRPPRSRVTGGGFSLFGDRKIEVPPGDGPEIRVNALSLFGDLQVSDRPSV